MFQIILIRPGSTDYNEQRRIQGTLDIPLSDEGATEVARMAEELKQRGIQAVYSSTGEPALATAQAIAAALDVKMKKLDGLANLNHGLWQGMLVEEVKRKQPKVYRQWQENPDSVRPPGGETVAEAQDRVDALVAKLVRRHKEGVIALVASEPIASVIRSSLMDTDLGDLWRAQESRANWELIEVEPPSLAHSG